MEKLSLIDMSSDDDLLSSSTYQCDRDLRCSENYNDREEVSPAKVSSQCDPVPKMSDSPERKQAKSGKVNLRKSLAWDNAFFTSEGVLNTEELGIVNSSFRKTGTCALSGIPEELRKSSESTSTLDSDSYSLASLEGDLFNLRDSIQMSVGRHDNITGVEPTPSCLDTEKGVQVRTKKAKPPIILRKVGMNKQQTERTSKEAAVGVDEVKKGTDGSKLALKPPRMVPKSSSLSMQSKDSSASLQMKINIKRPSSAVGSIAKTNGGVGNKTPRSIGLSKPNSSGKSLISTLTSSSITSPRDNSRKKLATRSDNSLSKPTTKTPTQTSKSRLGSSHHTTKFPQKASPSSSTDSFASEVSSSSASISSIKASNSIESFTSSNSSSPSLVPNKHVSPNNVEKRIPAAKTSLSFNSVPETSSKDNATRASTSSSNTGAKSFIPTGLRMPSPKIGYFDSEKSQVNNSSKIPHSDLRRSSMLKGSMDNNNIGANKAKSLKIPSKPSPKPMAVSSDSPCTLPSPFYKEDTYMENGLNSSTLDKVQKENALDSSKLDIVQKENELHFSTSDKTQRENGVDSSKSDRVQKENELKFSTMDNAQKENLFPLCDSNGLNHDSMLEKMTALSISTKKDNGIDI